MKFTRFIQTALVLGLSNTTPFTNASAQDLTGTYEVGFGPYVGGGSISDSSSVRHTSGYAVSIEKKWDINDRIDIGPRLEFVSAAMSTKSLDDQTVTTRSVDSNILAAGARIGYHFIEAPYYFEGIYLTGLLGRGQTEMVANESTSQTYIQNRYSNISGDYKSFELGTSLPIKGSFGINFALLNTIYTADLSHANGSREGDQLDEQGNVFSLNESILTNDNGLPNRAILKTSALKIGLVLGF